MLKELLGNRTAEKVLLFLFSYDQGYAKEISETFEISLAMVQNQLKKFENGGILVSQLKGKTRIYLWNPRYPFLKELKSLLSKAMEYMPDEEIRKYYLRRTRPRRTSKPL